MIRLFEIMMGLALARVWGAVSAAFLTAFLAIFLVFVYLPPVAAKTIREGSHGFAVLGQLKYAAGFKHFDYANPVAPKGGRLVLWYHGSYDSLHPFLLRGHPAAGSNPFGVSGRLLTFETLMIASQDEPDSYYGLIAKTVHLPDDLSSIAFDINPQARFHDGSAITADDVVFSFRTLKSKGHPTFKVIFRDVTGAHKTGPLSVRFDFAEKAVKRDLPVAVAGLPIISRAYFSSHDFSKAAMTPPLGSGPYKVGKIDPGRAVTYDRVRNHWARDLGVYRGRFNFGQIRWDYYRDRDVALEALFAGQMDFREEYTSKTWATKYNAPAVRKGLLKREVLADNSPSGFQAFIFNSRRAKFSDRRVRAAIGMAFDFEWTNKNLFHGLYRRTYSIFQNSDLEATGRPSPPEMALLQDYRDNLPREVFGPAYRAAKSDGSGNIRNRLRQAREILAEAGWKIRGGRLVNDQGRPFDIEFLSYGRGFERIIAPYIRNLERLGIKAKFRLVEPAQYKRRTDEYDFDIITIRASAGLTPGLGLRNRWHSEFADLKGGSNYAGVKLPVADFLIDRIMAARNREELRHATAAFDRVIAWHHYVVPQWFKASRHIAYWDRFSRPPIKPKFSRGVLDLWWLDAVKDAALKNKL